MPRYDAGDGLTVAYDDVFALIEARLRDQVQRCAEAEALAHRADRAGLDHVTQLSVAQAIAATSDARAQLSSLTDRFAMVRDLFGVTENAVSAGVEALAGQVAAVVGFVGSRLGLLGAAVLAGPALRIASAYALLPDTVRQPFERAIGDAAHDLAGQFAGPHTAEVTGWLVTLADDAYLGTLQLPPGLIAALGESGLGLASAPAVAAGALVLGLAGGARGTDPATVRRTDPTGANPGVRLERIAPAPRSVEDRFTRIPSGSGAQIRIERFGEGPRAHFEVYVAGTDPAAPVGGTNPFDMASNVALVAEQDATSLQAVRLALADAGATAESSVVFVGHSQGAAVAVQAAESDEWRTAGLAIAGGPIGGMPIAGDYPAIVVEHVDDPVVGLSGRPDPSTGVVVETSGYPTDGEGLIAAHDAERYRETAARIDASSNPVIADVAQRFPSSNVRGEVLFYRAERSPRE